MTAFRRVSIVLSLLTLLLACEGDPADPADAPDHEMRCPDCQPGEICVLPYDGLCGSPGPGICVASTCTGCTPECDEALCGRYTGRQFTCSATPCTTLPEDVFGCYGP